MKISKLIQMLLVLAIACAFTACESTDSSSDSGDRYPSSSSGSSYGDTPTVKQLSNGNFFVSFGGTKNAAFDPNGRMKSQYGLSSWEIRRAQQAVDSYLREQSGSDHHSPPSYGSSYGAPEVRPRGDGKLEVIMPGGCVILYNQWGGLIQKGRSCSDRDVSRANRAVQGYLREQGSSFSDV